MELKSRDVGIRKAAGKNSSSRPKHFRKGRQQWHRLSTAKVAMVGFGSRKRSLPSREPSAGGAKKSKAARMEEAAEVPVDER